jgi:hypothetical protein
MMQHIPRNLKIQKKRFLELQKTKRHLKLPTTLLRETFLKLVNFAVDCAHFLLRCSRMCVLERKREEKV